MSKKEKITVQGTEITVISEKNNVYICLTDMVKGQEGEDHIRNWMRNRNTLEFLGAWEMLHNSAFKGVEFDTFLHEAGANRFNMTPRKWIEATDAVGIISQARRSGYRRKSNCRWHACRNFGMLPRGKHMSALR